MKSVYQFKKVITYEVEANSYDEAVRMRDGLDRAVYEDGIVNNIYDEESVESGKWIFTGETSVDEIERVILEAIKEYGFMDDNGDVYTLTDKGRAFLKSLNDDEDVEDEFYDYITN